MRNALVKKIALVCCISLLNNFNTVGQSLASVGLSEPKVSIANTDYPPSCICKQMPVKVFGQETDLFCWAACIEMLFVFHGSSSPSQCDLAKEYILLGGDFNKVQAQAIKDNVECRYSSWCPASNNSGARTDAFTTTISFYRQGKNSLPHSFDLLFSKYGYHSLEQINRLTPTPTTSEIAMTWEEVKYQIDSCRPFIMMLANPSSGASGFHAVLARGYQEDGPTKLIYALDPWTPCVGSDSALPYSVFTTVPTSGGFLTNQVTAVVQEIYPKNATNPSSNISSCPNIREPIITNCCPGTAMMLRNTPDDYDFGSLGSGPSSDMQSEMKSKEDTTDNNSKELIAVLARNAEKVLGYRNNEYKEEEYKNKTQQKEYYATQVYYISYDSMLEKGMFQRTLNDVISSNQVEEVISKNVTPNVVSTFEKNNSSQAWELRNITFKGCCSIKEQIDSIEIKKGIRKLYVSLNNKASSADSLLYRPYKLVRYRPFLYEFYSFEFEGINYMSPAIDYVQLSLKAGIGYRENKVLNVLKDKTKENYKTEACALDKLIEGLKNPKAYPLNQKSILYEKQK